MFVGSGYRAAAFEVEAAYPPGSPLTVNGTTPATPVNSSARRHLRFGGTARPMRASSRAAGPLGEGTPANQIGPDVVWPKHGGPHRPRPAAVASCSAAAISSGRGMAVIDIGMGSTRTSRFDRVIPTVGLSK